MMVSRAIDDQYPRRRTEPEEVLLEVRNLSREGVLEDVSLSVRAGEIVGIAGIVGAGRTELARAIFSVDGVDAGEVQSQFPAEEATQEKVMALATRGKETAVG